MNHNQIISLIAVAFFGISTLFAQNATAKQSLANGIQAEQQGNNIAALTCYLQALTADKSLTEAKTRADTVLDEVAKGNFNTEFTSEKQNDNPVTLIKLREDWDKCRDIIWGKHEMSGDLLWQEKLHRTHLIDQIHRKNHN